MKDAMGLADAYQLLHAGTLALAEVEANGIRIDVGRLKETKRRIEDRQRQLRQDLQFSDMYRDQHKRFGLKTNLTSRPQLAAILSSHGHHIPRKETGNFQLDETVLATIDDPYCSKFLEYEKLNKLQGTYISGVAREVCKGYLHPSFNLHLVKTYRSSSDSPNFQNIPIRNEEIAKEITCRPTT